MTARAFITADDVAAIIGLPDGAAFLRQRARLEREHLFPLPMPTSLRPLRWKACEVTAWAERNGRAAPATLLPADPLAASVATGRAALTDMARTAH